MRQRRVTGIEERLAPYTGLILHGAEVAPDAPYPLRWYDRPSPRYALPSGYGRVYLELGCGRGRFINGMAAADPDALYIGAEGCKTILIRALAETQAAGHQNTRYIDGFVNDAASAFAESSLDGIFLNFSDPWPKIRHAGRRLTAPAKAEAYFRVLKPGGFIVLKTDGEDFFDYSLAVIMVSGFHIAYKTRDLQCREGAPCPGSPYDDYGASWFYGDYVFNVTADGAVDGVVVGAETASCHDYVFDVASDGAADAEKKAGVAHPPAQYKEETASCDDYDIGDVANDAVAASNAAAGTAIAAERPGLAICPVAERGAGMQTEYEKKFRADRLPIYCLIAIKK